MFRLIFIMSGFDSTYKLKESNIFIKKHYKESIGIDFIDSYKVDNSIEEYKICREKIEKSDMVFISMHGGVTHFKSLEKIMNEFEGKKKFFIYSGVEDENIVLLKKFGISPRQYEEILSYYSIGGNENLQNMILYLASNFGSKKFSYDSPKIVKWEGIYYPNKIIEDYTAYIKDIKKLEKPIIAILFYSKYFRENNTRHIDAFIEAIEELGGTPLAIYAASAPDLSNGCKGIKWVIDNILMINGEPQVDTIINTMAHAQSILGDPGDGTRAVEKSIFEDIDVPVLQAMPTYQSLESWENSIKGIDMMSLTSSDIMSIPFIEFSQLSRL